KSTKQQAYLQNYKKGSKKSDSTRKNDSIRKSDDAEKEIKINISEK
ncbi:1205_t:CDS:1, partial [Racocetra persica]